MVKLNKIYTRTGDAGTTGLVDGSRVSKACPRMQAIGDVDEANSAIGVAAVALGDHPLGQALERIQNDLFDLGADIATPGEDFAPSEMTLRIISSQVERLEAEIDAMNAHMTGGNVDGHVHGLRYVAVGEERDACAVLRVERRGGWGHETEESFRLPITVKP